MHEDEVIQEVRRVRLATVAERGLDVNRLTERPPREQQLDRGQPMPTADLLIAVTTLVHGLTPVTHNTQDFRNVPVLAMVDWLVP